MTMTDIETVKGLRLRPYAGEADIPEMVRIHNAEAEADDLPYRTTVEELRSHLSHPERVVHACTRHHDRRDRRSHRGTASREVVDTTDGVPRVPPRWRGRPGLPPARDRDGR